MWGKLEKKYGSKEFTPAGVVTSQAASPSPAKAATTPAGGGGLFSSAAPSSTPAGGGGGLFSAVPSTPTKVAPLALDFTAPAVPAAPASTPSATDAMTREPPSPWRSLKNADQAAVGSVSEENAPAQAAIAEMELVRPRDGVRGPSPSPDNRSNPILILFLSLILTLLCQHFVKLYPTLT